MIPYEIEPFCCQASDGTFRTRIMALFLRPFSQPYPLGYHKKPPQCLGSLACSLVVVSLIPYQTAAPSEVVGVSSPPAQKGKSYSGFCRAGPSALVSCAQHETDLSLSLEMPNLGPRTEIIGLKELSGKNSSADKTLKRMIRHGSPFHHDWSPSPFGLRFPWLFSLPRSHAG